MPDVLKATYADIKTVKTRGVCQIVLEMPIEGMQDAIALLGAPVPGNEVWCAIARLRTGADAPAIEPPAKKGTLAQQAGILCGEPAFQRLAQENGYPVTVDGAADFLRYQCNVTSRADLDSDAEAARKFRDLRADYKLWLSGVAA
jgi:hypothetical protein